MITLKTFILRPMLFSFMTLFLAYLCYAVISGDGIMYLLFFSMIFLFASVLNTCYLLILHLTGIAPYVFLNEKMIIMETVIIVTLFVVASMFLNGIPAILISVTAACPIVHAIFIYDRRRNPERIRLYERFFSAGNNKRRSGRLVMMSFAIMLAYIILSVILVCII